MKVEKTKTRNAIITILAVAYLVADCWLYKLSGLSLSDAIIIDIPVTIGALILIGVVYRLLGSDK
jgi:hypothetical protein